MLKKMMTAPQSGTLQSYRRRILQSHDGSCHEIKQPWHVGRLPQHFQPKRHDLVAEGAPLSNKGSLLHVFTVTKF